MKSKKKIGRAPKRSGKHRGPGRPPGAPNKATKETRDLVNEVIDLREIFERFALEVKKQKAGKMSRVAYLCGRTLIEYAAGKPPQPLSFSPDDENTSYTITFGAKNKPE